MKKLKFALVFLFTIILTACNSCEDFIGRYTNEDGSLTYVFSPEGKLFITTKDKEIKADYKYNAEKLEITLSADETLLSDLITVNSVASLSTGNTTLYRAADNTLLSESTWIGHQGQYSFALTFTQTEKGLETFSELITYHDDDMTYISQTDDSLTQLTGNQLLLDRTRYTVSEVTDKSLKLSIGNQNMVIEKNAKGTPIQIREGYSNIDDE